MALESGVFILADDIKLRLAVLADKCFQMGVFGNDTTDIAPHTSCQ